jgi:serine/threonine-protein kinase HipA
MPSDRDMAYVWVWLPDETEPVVCGRVDDFDGELRFTYARSYLDRGAALAIQPDLPHAQGLPLVSGTVRPPVGLTEHGVIRDAAPDSWGMRVLLRRLAGPSADDPDRLPLLTYLLASGSDRIGALDFQRSPEVYVPREAHGTLEELAEAAELLEEGRPIPEALADALVHGTAVGGARPKALLRDGDRALIAKFSVSTDVFPWVQAEAVGMELARRCGVRTAPIQLTRTAGRDVLLVDRFDRPTTDTRRGVVSALTMLGLNEIAVQHATYVDLAETVRLRFRDPDATLRELFTRLVVNVLVGNTDDHPRNHAAFVTGELLELTPAYDVCPQPRRTGETEQAMAFGVGGLKAARVAACVESSSVFNLSRSEAQDITDRCVTVVDEQYDDVCEQTGVTDATRCLLLDGPVLHPSVFYPRD